MLKKKKKERKKKKKKEKKKGAILVTVQYAKPDSVLLNIRLPVFLVAAAVHIEITPFYFELIKGTPRDFCSSEALYGHRGYVMLAIKLKMKYISLINA